jgi:hypothetical protein
MLYPFVLMGAPTQTSRAAVTEVLLAHVDGLPGVISSFCAVQNGEVFQPPPQQYDFEEMAQAV